MAINIVAMTSRFDFCGFISPLMCRCTTSELAPDLSEPRLDTNQYLDGRFRRLSGMTVCHKGQWISAKSRMIRNDMKKDFDWRNPSWTNLFITLPWAIGVLAAVLGWSADHTIAKRERTTLGVITAHKASRADRYLYTFSVNGDKIEGSGGAVDRYNIGDRVTVFYDPNDPNKNGLTDYKDVALGNFALVPFALTGIAGVAWYPWHAQRRNKPVP